MKCSNVPLSATIRVYLIIATSISREGYATADTEEALRESINNEEIVVTEFW